NSRDFSLSILIAVYLKKGGRLVEKDKGHFTKPDWRQVAHSDSPANDDIAELSDKDLEGHLAQNGSLEEKRMYRANPDFIIREIAGETLAVPTGKMAHKLNALITFTEGGAFLLECMKKSPQTKADLIRLLESRYDVATETAVQDVSAFLEKALANGIIS
ncbi:MAG: PqqD family protein, partial [Clostridiales bacterium]|nr:PqqD family protein [Clostridiales bacterium]